MVGSLNKNEQSTPYLLAVEQFEMTNSSTVSKFFTINLPWPNGIQCECILLFVIDAASYMIE
jgi:hypothetical protein